MTNHQSWLLWSQTIPLNAYNAIFKNQNDCWVEMVKGKKRVGRGDQNSKKHLKNKLGCKIKKYLLKE